MGDRIERGTRRPLTRSSTTTRAQERDSGGSKATHHQSSSNVTSSTNPAFASQIVDNPRGVTVQFQPATRTAPAASHNLGQSKPAWHAPFATAFSSSLSSAPDPQPYCAPIIRPYLEQYEQFWRMNDWETAHPVTANKVFIFLDSHVLTLPQMEKAGFPIVRETINALDQYIRDNSHLAAYAYPQNLLIDSIGQPLSLRCEPRLQGLEALESLFFNSDQAYKTAVNLFRLHLTATEVPTTLPTVDSVRLHGVIRQRTILLLARWLIPRVAFSFVPHLAWANMHIDLLPSVGHETPGIETPALKLCNEDLFLSAFIAFSLENGGANEFMYTARRHQLAELCSIGALAWYFFSEFHIAKHPVPDFASYTITHDGQVFRHWHAFALIPDQVFFHADLNHYTPMMNRSGIIHGRLSPNEYSPVEAESLNANRHSLTPPKALLRSIFPWIERERDAYALRLGTLGLAVATDLQLCRFLDTLNRFRTVILQDAFVMCLKYPDCPMFRLPIFDCIEFRQYVTRSKGIVMQPPLPVPTLGGRKHVKSNGPSGGDGLPKDATLGNTASLPKLPDVDEVFSILGDENVVVEALSGSPTGVEKGAKAPPLRLPDGPPTRRTQARRFALTRDGHQEKPRDTHPTGTFWASLVGIDAAL